MDFASKIKCLRGGQTPSFPAEANTLQYAQSLDAQDEIGHLRGEFLIPTKRSLKKKALNGALPGTSPTSMRQTSQPLTRI